MKKEKNIAEFIKAALAVLMIGCFLNVPYGYFQVVRLLSFVGFIYLGYHNKNIALALGCYALAILFNPIEKVSFSKSVWNVFDGIIGSLLFLWIIISIIIPAEKIKSDK